MLEVKYLTLNFKQKYIPIEMELYGNGFEFVLYCCEKL